MFKSHLLLFILLSSLTGSLFAADISVSIDRNPVNLQESFQLTFTASYDPDGEPDFSPLDKDFEILNQSQQQSVQIINWEKTKSIQWILIVMAKHTGKLVIPAINFGNDSSQFAAIVVNDSSQVNNTNEDLFLQVEVSTTEPYIQQQVIYTLKLFRKVNIAQASLTEPELADALIEKLGEDTNYNTQFQGENYVVTKRKYAIFPQKSGIATITPLSLTAGVIIPGQRRSNSFFNQQRTRTKQVVSAAIKLDVQAKPENTGVDWLPAKQLALQEQWSDNSERVIVGQPITRTISLFADGATVGVLPELYQDNMPKNLKAYPDQPVLKEEAKEDGMVAFREEKIALIPGQAGSYTLPPIEIPWWNTQTQQMEVARIAAHTLTAIAASSSTAETQIAQSPPLMPTPELSTPVDIAPDNSQKSNKLWLGLAIFFACGWAVTVLYFLTKKSNEAKKESRVSSPENTQTIEKQLKKACTNNDPVQAKDALLKWGRDNFQQSSLTKIAEQGAPDFQQEILSLNAILYSDKAQTWQGAELWVAFQNHQSTDLDKSEKVDPLPPLFKI
ncbi:MAG TPA: protein BatD [Methyloprofundus sp.]|nr:protein BatD [Methyloprofundus sp.]HIL78154.1 protein BatD [Methylococcales bacterium]